MHFRSTECKNKIGVLNRKQKQKQKNAVSIHCVDSSIVFLSFSALFCGLRAQLSDFKLNLPSWRHQQTAACGKTGRLKYFIPCLWKQLWWDWLFSSGSSPHCFFRIKGVMTSHCYWSLGAYKCASILMCGSFPHITKQFSYTSWIS